MICKQKKENYKILEYKKYLRDFFYFDEYEIWTRLKPETEKDRLERDIKWRELDFSSRRMIYDWVKVWKNERASYPNIRN
jgi:hypothetical protein